MTRKGVGSSFKTAPFQSCNKPILPACHCQKKVPIFATKVHCPALYPSQHCTASMMNCLTCSSCKYHHCTVAWPVQFPLSAALLLIVAIKEITPGSRLPPHQLAGQNSKSPFSSLLPLSPCLFPMFVFNLFFIFLNIPYFLPTYVRLSPSYMNDFSLRELDKYILSTVLPKHHVQKSITIGVIR